MDLKEILKTNLTRKLRLICRNPTFYLSPSFFYSLSLVGLYSHINTQQSLPSCVNIPSSMRILGYPGILIIWENLIVGTPTLLSTIGSINRLTIHISPLFVRNQTLINSQLAYWASYQTPLPLGHNLGFNTTVREIQKPLWKNMMGLNNRLITNLMQKLKLIGKCPTFYLNS